MTRKEMDMSQKDMSEKKKIWEKMPKADLLKELGRYEKKIRDQGKQIAQMRAEGEEMRGGMAEVSALVDSVIGRLIDKYGSIGYGGEFITLPQASIGQNDFRLRVYRTDDMYIVIRYHADKGTGL